MHFEREVSPSNYAEGLKWCHLAAEQGDADAQLALGKIYSEGKHVVQDYVQAHMWLNLAVTETDHLHRDELAIKMTRRQIAEAQRLARDWLLLHPPD